MSDMVERVARAICRTYGGKMALRHNGETFTNVRLAGYPWRPDGGDADEYVNDHWRSFKPLAYAAIEALRNPPDHVLNAMNPSGRYASTVTPEAWNDAIDAILKDGD